MTRRTRAIGGGLMAAVLLSGAAACGGKYTEPFRDAHVAHRNSGPAEVGTMPDGFSNWADKCDGHGHRVFVAYHGDNHYGAIAVVDDPTC